MKVSILFLMYLASIRCKKVKPLHLFEINLLSKSKILPPRHTRKSSLVQSLVLILLIGFLVATRPAHASYGYPVYSGGQTTTVNSGSTSHGNYINNGTVDWLGSGGIYDPNPGNAYNCSGAANGTLQATVAWQGTSPAPQNAIATETMYVQCHAFTYNYSTQGNPTASCTDGMGGSGTFTPTYPSGGPLPEEALDGSFTHTRYSGQMGSGFTVTCSPQANASTTLGDAYVSIGYQVTTSAIGISLTGPVLDGSQVNNILVGQKCTAKMTGIPAALLPFTTYSWSVGGTTFQTWQPTTPAMNGQPANSMATYRVDGPGNLTAAQLSFYWNNPTTNLTDTIKCVATITFPGSNSFSISATQTVKVILPTWTAYGIGGYMQVNSHAPPVMSGVSLWAGPLTTNPNEVGGMNWTATSSTPALFKTGSQPYGQLLIVQTVIPNEGYYTNAMPPVAKPDPFNNMLGLDTQYPYPGPPGGYLEGPTPYMSDDSPSIEVEAEHASSAWFTMQPFYDYLMYEPPNSSQFVPLATFTWTINGSATIPSTKNWYDYASEHGGMDGVGTVTPSTQMNFTASNGWPAWTVIDLFNF